MTKNHRENTDVARNNSFWCYSIYSFVKYNGTTLVYDYISDYVHIPTNAEN